MHVVATLHRMKHRRRCGVRDCSRIVAVGNPQASRTARFLTHPIPVTSPAQIDDLVGRGVSQCQANV